jgi:hypothetical protein
MNVFHRVGEMSTTEDSWRSQPGASVIQGKTIEASSEFESQGWPPTSGTLSTNATCQPERTENSRDNPCPPTRTPGGIAPQATGF